MSLTLSVPHDRQDIGDRYRQLDQQLPCRTPEEGVHADVLICFPYPADGARQNVIIDTDEFTAVCPWTGLPDYGSLTVTYVPQQRCLELKSLKYYLLSYRDVGIVQEHVTDRILRDLVAACEPQSISVRLDYKPRGGIHTVTEASYPSS